MLITCWSVKGGVGTTVVAAALAMAGARATAAGALLVDLAGDQPGAFGLPEPEGPGVAGWSRAREGAPPDALGRLTTSVRAGLALLPQGPGPLAAGSGAVLAAMLSNDGRCVVVDAGRLGADPEVAAVVAVSGRSLLVTRNCHLALARAQHCPVVPTGVVLVREPGRALTTADVEHLTGAPLVADLAVDPAVARAVDAGLLAARLPRRFAAALQQVVEGIGPEPAHRLPRPAGQP